MNLRILECVGKSVLAAGYLVSATTAISARSERPSIDVVDPNVASNALTLDPEDRWISVTASCEDGCAGLRPFSLREFVFVQQKIDSL